PSVRLLLPTGCFPIEPFFVYRHTFRTSLARLKPPFIMFNNSETLLMQPAEFQDLLLCESYFDDFTHSTEMDRPPSPNHITPQAHSNIRRDPAQQQQPPPPTSFSSFEAQLQALLAGNNASPAVSQPLQSNFNSFDWDLGNTMGSASENSIFSSPEILAAMSSPESKDGNMILLPTSPLTFSSPSGSSPSMSPPYHGDLHAFPNDFTMPSPPNSYRGAVPHYNKLDSISMLNERDYYGQPQQTRTMSVANIMKDERTSEPRDIPTDHNARKRRKSIPLTSPTGVLPAAAKKMAAAKGVKATAAKRRSADDSLDSLQAINIPVTPSNEFPPSSATSLMSIQNAQQQQQQHSQQSNAATSQFATAFNQQQSIWPGVNALVDMKQSMLGGDTQKIPIQRLKPPTGLQLPPFPPQPTKQQKKVAHNAIERRYRNNINDRISDLKSVVPALCHGKIKDKSGSKNMDDDEDDDENEIDGVAAATKLNKATILRKATEYIVYLKKNSERVREENAALKNLVAQMPRGHDILAVFEAQQQAREQAHKEAQDSPSEYGDDDEFSPNSNTPPSNGGGGRALMALFMCVTFFSASPLTAGPQQQLNHHHEGRAMGQIPTANVVNTSYSSALSPRWIEMLAGLNYWTIFRTLAFALCVAYFCLPSSIFKFRRVNSRNSKRKSGHVKYGNPSYKLQTAQQFYNALVASLPHSPPTSYIGLAANLLVEGFRLVIRRSLGIDVSYNDTELYDNELALAGTWMRIGEVECTGGNPNVSRMSMLYHCIKTINVFETIEEEHISNPFRIYATAAIQVAIAIPSPSLARKASQHLWRLAMHSAEVENDEESAEWIESLLWDVHDDDYEDRMENMVDSEIWCNALEVMKKSVHFDRAASTAVAQRRGRRHGRKAPTSASTGISLAVASTVPIEILSNFQSYYNLQIVFGRLIKLISTPAPSSAQSDIGSEYIESIFDPILSTTIAGSVPHWYALVGAAVEAFWKADLTLGEKYVCQLRQLPKNVAADPEDEATLKGDLTKRVIAYTLLGVAFLKRVKITEGVRVLEKAQNLQQDRKKVSSSGPEGPEPSSAHPADAGDLESSVCTLAEFVVGLCGLEAWIDAWRRSEDEAAAVHEESDARLQDNRPISPKEEELDIRGIHASIMHMIKTLRRMVNTAPLKSLDTTQELLKRLCRVDRMVFDIDGDVVDSGVDYEEEGEIKDELDTKEEGEINIGERALKVLRGVR
ncbi:hypothetical protein BC936DRAFT_141741, partial [Jimgerdemannia flammicorona]